MTDMITVTAGAPQVDIAPGVYEVTLIEISEPRTILPQSGPNAGKEVSLRDWLFSLEDGTELRGSASTASGPKSKTFAWLTALLGGTPPPIGSSYPRDQLVGRMALATVTLDDGGWPKISNLSALPRSRVAVAAAPVAPVRPRAASGAPLNGLPVAGEPSADLPF
jgi:hypothetical protein